MGQTRNIPVDIEFKQYLASDSDLRRASKPMLRHMLFHLYLIREVESRLLELKDNGQVHGPVHSSIGQDGTAVGAMQALTREDRVTSTHRGHHHFLAKAYNAYAGSNYDPTESIPDAIGEVTERAMAEIMGLVSGYCRGRGGSMHLGDKYSGCIGTNAIVAGGVPAAAGAAWAHKLSGGDHVGVAFGGDGAIGQGVVYETMNLASLWRVPAIFFIENNLYAVATHVQQAFAVEHLAQRGLGFGVLSLVVDGMDPLAVYLATEHARSHALSAEGGPVLIEAKNYRFKHQAQSLPGSAYGYRTKEEEAEWASRDPFVRYPERLKRSGALDDGQDAELRARAESIVADAVRALTKIEGGATIVRPELFPGRDEVHLGVRSDGREFREIDFVDWDDLPEGRERKFIDVIPEVIHARVDEDDRIVILGEEVAQMKGGVFMATKGIYHGHPDRVVNTPISEAGFSGMALGLALMGFRPIVELMYPDFVLVAADQVLNQIPKFRYMYGNQYDVPMVFRTKVGIGTGYGAQHSMEPAPIFGMYPGWRVVAPAFPRDYVGLFNTAVRSLDPVFLIEHALLYETTDVIHDDRDYCIPFGRARVARKGRDLTILAYSYMTIKALRAAKHLEDEGISAEVVDLRTVDYASIDWDAIGTSLTKTGRLLICEEGLFSGGLGGQIAFEVQRRFFDYLDAEIERVAAEPVPVPVSQALESMVIPGPEEIVEAAKRITA